MGKRKTITERMKIDALLYMVLDSENPICCHICKMAIQPEVRIEWDHLKPHWLGGDESYLNLRPVHYDCHKKKTFHPRSKATTLGGDNFEAKKASRIARGGKKRKGPAMKYQGFGKQHRPMRG